MKILFAADGSDCTKKALAFLVAHEGLGGAGTDLLVLNVQTPLPPRVGPMVGSDVVDAYHHDEADKVLGPIRAFLDRHALAYRCETVVGSPAAEVLGAARRGGVHMIVMGTRGHGLLGRIVMGSVAQRVVAESDVPVLLVK